MKSMNNEVNQRSASYQQEASLLNCGEGFLPVELIKLGMHVMEVDGQLGVISGWKVVPGVKTMYNLEVTQDHKDVTEYHHLHFTTLMLSNSFRNGLMPIGSNIGDHHIRS
jgi:hypothetical protein